MNEAKVNAKLAAECADKLVRKFPQIEPLVLRPALKREATLAFGAFIERISDLEQEVFDLRSRLGEVER